MSGCRFVGVLADGILRNMVARFSVTKVVANQVVCRKRGLQ